MSSSSSSLLQQPYNGLSRWPAIALVASLGAFGCGDVALEDEEPAASELETPESAQQADAPPAGQDDAPEETGLTAIDNANGLSDASTAGDKAGLARCYRTERVPQPDARYFIAPAAAPGSGIFCTMRQGDRNAAVYKLKQHFRACHGATWDSLDGDNNYFGPGVTGAVLWVQREAGMVQDGVYGPQTFTTAVKWLKYGNDPTRRPICAKFN